MSCIERPVNRSREHDRSQKLLRLAQQSGNYRMLHGYLEVPSRVRVAGLQQFTATLAPERAISEMQSRFVLSIPRRDLVRATKTTMAPIQDLSRIPASFAN